MKQLGVCTIVLCLGVAMRTEAATVSWDPNPEPDVLGYVLAYGTASGVYTTEINVGNRLSYEFFPPPGCQYYLVVRAYSALGSGPNSNEVVLNLADAPNQPPTLQQPPNHMTVVGQPTSLTLVGNDPEGRSLTYSASGLPPGLGVHVTTGIISGAASAAGTFTVRASVSDGALTATRAFGWRVTAAPPPADTTPPAVTITSWATGSRSDGKKVTLEASATDANGIAGVQFMVDGIPVGTEDATAPFTAVWNTTANSGAHEVTAVARDRAGNTGVAPAVTITIRNGNSRRR